MPFLDQRFSELQPFLQQLGGDILRSELLSSCFPLVCVCVSDGGSITFYRPPCNLGSMIFRKIFLDCKYAAFFLRFAAGIADSRAMTKQPIMIRVVVVCSVTGVYRVRWVPMTHALPLPPQPSCGDSEPALLALPIDSLTFRNCR